MPPRDVSIDPHVFRSTPFPRKMHYPGLDGIRTLAVALVFLFHFTARLFPWGWAGVQLFFVLSGFLITGILFASQNDDHRFKKFYARRALRIFPLYYGLIGLFTVISLVTHGSLPSHFWIWWVYVQNFVYILSGPVPDDLLRTGSGHIVAGLSHLWSLAVEEQFYFLWPLVVFFVKDRRALMRICCAGILLRIALATYWQTHLSLATLQLGLAYRMLPTQCDGFLMGGFLALWLRGTPSPRILRRSGLFGGLALLTYAGLLVLLHRAPRLIFGQDVFDFNQGFQATLGIPLVNLASAFLLLAAIEPGTWAYRLFTLKPMRSLGVVSYGLYFYHVPVAIAAAPITSSLYVVLGRHGREHLWQSTVAVLLTVAVSYLSFYLFETPFLRLKHRLRFSPRFAPAIIPVGPAVNPPSPPIMIPVSPLRDPTPAQPELTFLTRFPG